jgi:hypothetical protein
MKTDNGTFYRPMVTDQKLYKVDGLLKAEIDVDVTHIDKDEDAPSIAECRHAVLQIKNGSKRNAYVIYDRLLCRIVNGVYYMPLQEVLECAQAYNDYPEYSPENMAPYGSGLGLKYPKVTAKKR